jgi:hypothetical protein
MLNNQTNIYNPFNLLIMNNPLVTYDWNRKLFTSQIRLWELSRVGAINVKIEERTYGSD